MVGAGRSGAGRTRSRLLWLASSAMLPLVHDVETDAELVRRAGAQASGGGARDAEKELCRRFAPRARLYGLRHLRDGEKARDLVQTVLVALIEAVRGRRVEEPEHVDRFVLGACRNVVARMRDGEARAIAVDPGELDVAGGMPPLERLDVEALFRCLRRLDERSRAVVQMCFHDEKSADEIGSVLGTTAGNVRVLRHRALAQLRSCLDAGPRSAA
jgi:RNA polymerase sigma-70 factor (ECF subfamily)